MRASHRWGLVAAILVLLGVGLWLSLGRKGDEQASEDATATNEPTNPLAKPTKPGDRRDSTATLLRSDKATLTGTVREEQGQPIAGATVCAWPDEQKLRGASDGRPSCAKTEQDGHYRLEGLWPVSTAVSASAPEYIPARWSERVDGRLRYQLSLRAGQERSVDLTLARGGVPVRGVVKDISGGVIEGALVNAATGWFGNSALAVAWTDDEGRFELWAEPGDLSLRASAEGYADANTDSVAPTERAEIFLTPESVITGVVTHAETNAPVAGATVQAGSSGFFGGGGGGGIALSDEDGRFRITGIAPGIYELTAVTDELFGESVEQIHLGLAEQAEANVRVHPAFAVRGRVVIAETGEPCSSGYLNLDGDDFDKYTRIEEDGSVLIQAVLPGEYDVSLTCEGYMPEDKYEPLVIADASVDGLEWSVHTGLSIRGIVVDHRGEPVEEVNVQAMAKPKPGDDPRAQRTSQWGAETEADGVFELGGLLAGGYEIRVWGQGHPPLPEPLEVELAEGTNVEDLRVVLPAAGRLEGIVRDEAGELVAGVTVSTVLVDDSWSGTRARTGDDGRFRFEHVQIGRHRVTAELGWFNQMRAPGTTDDDVQGEIVEVTEQAAAEVELVVERRAGTIRGRVVDGDGGPIGDAFVDATRMSDSAAAATAWSRVSMRWGWDRKPVLTDHDGAFELRELADGNYMVRAYREGGGEALLEGVAVGTTDAVLKIVETGRIAGKVTLAGGGTPQRFDVRLRERSAGLERSDDFFRTSGAFSLRELPPGKYELTVSASEGSAQVTVELGSGQVIDDLAIELVAKVTVKGRLIDADTRAPVPGMRVAVQTRGNMFMFGGDESGDRRDVSDADGRFEVEDAPTGKVTLSIMPREFTESESYGWTGRSMVLPTEPSVQDIGELELLASRVKLRDDAGDTGFKTKPNEPDVEPEDIVFEVAVIRPGGPAEGSGLEVGDRIVEVDGRTVSGLDSHRWWKLVKAPAGTVIELTIEGGEKVKIELGPPLEW